MKVMKYLKNSKILFVLLMVFQLVSLSLVRAEQAIAVFSEELSKGHNVKVKLEGDSYWLREGKKEWVLLKAGVLRGGEAKPVLFLDANGDGVKDIFLKLFESGANNAYALFFAKLQDNNVFYFSESKEVFGSPYLGAQGELVSVKRNGPFSTIAKYRGKRGGLYLYELREPINSDVEKVTIFDGEGKAKSSINYFGTNTTASACVSSERAYLSESPSVAGLMKSYLVKGDSLSVLDSDSDGEWFRVRCQGNIVTDAWLPQVVLDFNDSSLCVEQ
ncbi:hypothetical protein [Pseudomonas sp. 18173]|uniref:hypothetical protein n=1 Tax=Pseudomonas sp. 18173 TaxID=3390055 RepID=UPI003D1D52B1